MIIRSVILFAQYVLDFYFFIRGKPLAAQKLQIIIIIIIIITVARIKVTLSHKCCRGTVHRSLSQVWHWSNVSYTAAAAQLCSVVLKRRIEQQRLQIAPEYQI